MKWPMIFIISAVFSSHAYAAPPSNDDCEALLVSMQKSRSTFADAKISVSVRNCGKKAIKVEEADLPWGSTAALEFWIEVKGRSAPIESLYPIADGSPGVKLLLAPRQVLMKQFTFKSKFPDIESEKNIEGAIIYWKINSKSDDFHKIVNNPKKLEGILGVICRNPSTLAIDSVCKKHKKSALQNAWNPHEH